MSTATEIHPSIAHVKRTTDHNKGRLLKTFSFVPDDQLAWSPAPTCKNALRLVAHCAVTNSFFAGIISRTPPPEGVPFSELIEEGKRQEEAITTREQAVAALEASVEEVQKALDRLTPEDIASEVQTPMFTAPMQFFMFLPARHMDNHAAQIDMLQTCWGDMDWHM